MKRFRFPLRPIAILRAHQEMRAREAFAASVQAYVKSEEELRATRARVQTLEVEMTADRLELFSPAEATRSLIEYRRECTAETEAEQATLAARNAMNQRRIEYVDAHRRLEIVRRLEEKARAAHAYEMLREQQAEFDDVASQRFGRRPVTSV